MFVCYLEKRSEAVDALVAKIIALRNDPELRNPEIFRRLYLDPAGEWHTRNADAMKKLQDIGVQVILRATASDKRQQPLAEATMRIIEERTKKIMITTRLEVEMWKEACDHAVWLSNLLCPTKLAGPG